MQRSLRCLLTLAALAALAGVALPSHAVDLEREVQRSGQDGQEWLVYSIESNSNQEFACCNTWRGGIVRPATCRPERDRDSWSNTDDGSILPGDGLLHVYLGMADGQVERVRAYSSGCEVDTSWPLRSLEGVSQKQSLGLLQALAFQGTTPDGKGGHDDRMEHALATIAKHETSSAAQTLISLSVPGRPREMREQALFWLSQVGGSAAEEAIFGALRNDPSSAVREHAVFALSQLPDEQGVDALLRALRTSNEGAVQRQALFWLAESNDPRALETIARLLD